MGDSRGRTYVGPVRGLPSAKAAPTPDADKDPGPLPEISVTPMREGLLGIVITASVGEIYPEGRADIHERPLEPIMMQSTITKQYGH